jgi:hypothetical protein
MDPFFPRPGHRFVGWLAQPADQHRVTFHRRLAAAMAAARAGRPWHEAEAAGARILQVTVIGGAPPAIPHKENHP